MIDGIEVGKWNVKKQLYRAVTAINSGAQNDSLEGFLAYKKALKVHLKFVSINLYLPLRGALAGDPRLDDFKRFEAETFKLNELVGIFLNRYLESSNAHREKYIKAFYRIERLITQRDEEERNSLYPVLLSLQVQNKKQHLE